MINYTSCIFESSLYAGRYSKLNGRIILQNMHHLVFLKHYIFFRGAAVYLIPPIRPDSIRIIEKQIQQQASNVTLQHTQQQPVLNAGSAPGSGWM